MKRKILSIGGKSIFAVVIIAVLSLAILNRNNSEPYQSDGNVKEKTKLVKIPLTHEIPEGETKEYIFSNFYVAWTSSTGQSIEDWIVEMEEYNKDKVYYDEVYANEDGSITYKVTNGQLLYWISTTEEILEEQILENDGKMDIIITDDFKKVTFNVYPEYTTLEWSFSTTLVILNLMKAQIFTGVPVEECVVETTTISVKTGEVIENTVFPGGSNEIPGTEWDTKVNGKAKEE